jgi:hypothetical protein
MKSSEKNDWVCRLFHVPPLYSLNAIDLNVPNNQNHSDWIKSLLWGISSLSGFAWYYLIWASNRTESRYLLEIADIIDKFRLMVVIQIRSDTFAVPIWPIEQSQFLLLFINMILRLNMASADLGLLSICSRLTTWCRPQDDHNSSIPVQDHKAFSPGHGTDE